MKAPGVSPEHIASSPHPIDAYYDEIFDAATAEMAYFPYDVKTGLTAVVAADHIRLADPDIDSYELSISRIRMWGDATLVFSACNTVDNQRHPLLYPARIMERAVPLLEGSGPVDAVQAYWVAPPAMSVNYAEYAAGLQRLAPGRVPTEAEQALAARGTWTDQQLSRLGYSTVREVLRNSSGNIQAFFARP